MQRLTGEALIEYIKTHPDQSKTDVAWATGYYVEKGPDEVSYRFSELQDAIIQAQGLSFGNAPKSKTGRRRGAGILSVGSASGALVVGRTYIEQAGGEPSDRFEVVSANDGEIVLRKRPALAAVA